MVTREGAPCQSFAGVDLPGTARIERALGGLEYPESTSILARLASGPEENPLAPGDRRCISTLCRSGTPHVPDDLSY